MPGRNGSVASLGPEGKLKFISTPSLFWVAWLVLPCSPVSKAPFSLQDPRATLTSVLFVPTDAPKPSCGPLHLPPVWPGA